MLSCKRNIISGHESSCYACLCTVSLVIYTPSGRTEPFDEDLWTNHRGLEVYRVDRATVSVQMMQFAKRLIRFYAPCVPPGILRHNLFHAFYWQMNNLSHLCNRVKWDCIFHPDSQRLIRLESQVRSIYLKDDVARYIFNFLEVTVLRNQNKQECSVS